MRTTRRLEIEGVRRAQPRDKVGDPQGLALPMNDIENGGQPVDAAFALGWFPW